MSSSGSATKVRFGEQSPARQTTQTVSAVLFFLPKNIRWHADGRQTSSLSCKGLERLSGSINEQEPAHILTHTTAFSRNLLTSKRRQWMRRSLPFLEGTNRSRRAFCIRKRVGSMGSPASHDAPCLPLHANSSILVLAVPAGAQPVVSS